MSPASANRSDGPQTYTFRGEVFSPSPTVKISKDGVDVVGTSVARADDQTVTATIDPLNQAVGTWAVTLANSDGKSDTLTAGFTITFLGGELHLTDNLMRPLKGGRTQIDMVIFDNGRLHAKLYTMSGRLLKTLLDEDRTIGTTTIYWDGRNDDGNLVASGTYVLEVTGPKLDTRRKIVVIK